MNQVFRSTIASSSALRKMMFLTSDDECSWRTPFVNIFPGTRPASVVRSPMEPAARCVVTAKSLWRLLVGVEEDERLGRFDPFGKLPHPSVRPRSFEIPRLNLRQRSMLICQPPISEMEAIPQCCQDRSRVPGRFESGPFRHTKYFPSLPQVTKLESPN